MIFVALTKPKKKLGAVCKLLFLVLLLGVVVPYAYICLSEAGAMQSYVQTIIKQESSPAEPIRVEEDASELAPVETVWYQVRNLLIGEELIPGYPVNNLLLP